MIIARFGDTWATAYALGTYKAEDDWGAERSQVIQQIGGASGAFDFYGDDAYPVSPLRVRKRFELTASTYAGIETALNTLRLSTIVTARTKLWGVLRDGSTHRWAWAKCTGMQAREIYGGQYLNMPVELEFICPEGVWYAETQSSSTGHGGMSGRITATNYGNYPAFVRAVVVCAGADLTSCVLDNYTNDEIWTFGATVLDGDTLVVDAGKWECTNDGVDAYADLTIGANQVAWMTLDPSTPADYGYNYLDYTFTGVSASFTLGVYWYNTYVL